MPPLSSFTQKVYPRASEFVASTAVARANGYLGGEGSFSALLKELDGLGLSPARKEELRELVQQHKGGEACPVPGK